MKIMRLLKFAYYFEVNNASSTYAEMKSVTFDMYE